MPIGLTMGFHVTDVAPGEVVLTGSPDARFFNLIGTIHGGWAASILDTTMALATLSTLDASRSRPSPLHATVSASDPYSSRDSSRPVRASNTRISSPADTTR